MTVFPGSTMISCFVPSPGQVNWTSSLLGSDDLIVETQPGAVCAGERQGHYGDEYSIKLPSHTIPSDGHARWQWSVLNGNNPIGDRGVHLTCTADGKSGSLSATFSVR